MREKLSNKQQRGRRLGDAEVRHSQQYNRMYQQLGESRALMRAIADSAANGIITLNDNGTILEFNPAAEAIYGLSRSAVVGTHIKQYVSPAYFRKSKGDILGLLQTEKETPPGGRWQTSVVGYNGRVTPVELSVSRTETREGLLVTIFMRDISAAQKAAQKLRCAIERAEKATEAKGRYLATMSHEIRTPLNAVLGSLDLLAESRLTREQQQLLEAARLSGRAVKNVTDDIIDLAKIESGHLQLNNGPFDLNVLVDDTVHSIAPGAYAKGLEICLLIDANVPRHLIGDMNRLQQILLNFLTNAVKFTNKGAVILHLAAKDDNSHTITVRFSIADCRHGKDQRQQENSRCCEQEIVGII